MDTTKLVDLIPAVMVLLSVMIIIIIVLLKYGNKVFDKDYKTPNILLFVTAFLFTTILIVHLFKEQTWTADTLKILIGVLVGAGSTKLSEKKYDGGSSVELSGDSKVGGDVAGRDINKNIQNIQEAISKIESSIVHQNNQIKQIMNGETETLEDFIFHFLYYTRTLHKDIETVVTKWTAEGYQFKEIVSDFKGFDGMILVFSKPSETEKSTVLYYRDGSFDRIEKKHYDDEA